jgi:signal peptidase I
MAMTDAEFELLKTEAQQLHTHYRSLKSAATGSAPDPEREQEMEKIRLRYLAIEELLTIADEVDAGPIRHLPNFEVEPFRVHKPIAVADHHDGVLNQLLTLATPRKVISTTLAIFLVSLFVMVNYKHIGFFVVPSSSMEPTLIPNDKLVTFRKSEYKRGDVVVLRDPKDDEAFLVKRIVAMEKDDIYVMPGQLKVNNHLILEPYIMESINYQFGPYKVPEGQIFVLGDNRNNSEDGHFWEHAVPLDSVIGQVKYIYAPTDRLGQLHSGANAFENATKPKDLSQTTALNGSPL